MFRQSWRAFHILAQLLFTINETELNYYLQSMSLRVAEQVAEQCETQYFGKLGNFKKIPEILGFDSKYSAGHSKAKF